uniref:Uncharacterized protein n=1 Tax=Angiostrongylus cantonensis TaxID=6313 RepID=A0A0K0CUF0_ANGCA
MDGEREDDCERLPSGVLWSSVSKSPIRCISGDSRTSVDSSEVGSGVTIGGDDVCIGVDQSPMGGLGKILPEALRCNWATDGERHSGERGEVGGGVGSILGLLDRRNSDPGVGGSWRRWQTGSRSVGNVEVLRR